MGDDHQPHIFGLELEEIGAFLQSWQEPAYRATQIWDWVYKKAVFSFAEMLNLPLALRKRLEETFSLSLPEVVKVRSASDNTSKYLLQLDDGQKLESVAIAEGNRLTACLSSQIGCGIGCPFCATGMTGLVRNLAVHEIVGQLLVLQVDRKRQVSTVVMMGMGEPLANYDALMKALRLMNDGRGLGLGARRFTVSTAGVVPGIQRLAEEELQVNLAVSLHAATDDLRDQLVPLNRTFPIESLIHACRQYIKRTARRITFEYVLLQDVNDTPDQAKALGELLKNLLCHVNLIPYNPVAGTSFEKSSARAVKVFAETLAATGVQVSVRKEKGAAIDAACGQLRSEDEVRAF